MLSLLRSILILTTILSISPPAHAADRQVLVFDIKGMHCSGCASGIKAMLVRVEGVTKAEVSYEETRARVEYDPDRTTSATIIETVEKLGYKARPRK